MSNVGNHACGQTNIGDQLKSFEFIHLYDNDSHYCSSNGKKEVE